MNRTAFFYSVSALDARHTTLASFRSAVHARKFAEQSFRRLGLPISIRSENRGIPSSSAEATALGQTTLANQVIAGRCPTGSHIEQTTRIVPVNNSELATKLHFLSKAR